MDGETDAMDGLLQRVAVLEADLEACRRAGAEMQRIGQRWRRLFDASTEGFWVIDAHGVTVFTSRATAEMLGFSVHQLLGRPLLSAVSEEWQMAIRGAIEGASRGAKSQQEFRFTHGNGGERWANLSVSPDFDEEGNYAGALGVITDITQRKLAEQALRESEERLRTITDNMLDMVSQIDEWGVILYASPSHRNALGYELDELLGRCALDLVHPDDLDRVAAAVQDALKRRSAVKTELRYRRSDGSYLWLEAIGRPLFDEEGHCSGLICVCRDSTDRKRLEAQLLSAQRLETAGRIAAQVAHDFNNLLSPFVGYPDLIQRQLPPGHPILAYCEDMKEAALQMAGINEDMLALGRRGRVEPQSADLNRLIRQVIGQLPALPGSLKAHLELDPDLLPVGGAPAQLLRVIANLVANAREAMQDRGLLTIRTESFYLDDAEGRSHPDGTGEYVRLTVQDTGCGISEEVREKIFDAFFTTKRSEERRGCGLGLSVVQAIVDDHGGFVELASEVGKGSTFSLYLPVSRDLPEEPPGEEPVGGTETILVVDDDRRQREILRRLLEPMGYRVEVASSEEAAVAHLCRQPADLLILDLVMQGRIDGAETYRRIQKVKPGQRALILSSFTEPERVTEMVELGAIEYLRKPVTYGRLALSIRKVLDRASG